jgi:hypothetical protein
MQTAARHRATTVGGLGIKRNTVQQAVIVKGGMTRVNQCHTFAWSRTLWAKAAKDMAINTSVLLVLYLALVSWCMYLDGLRGIDIPYFLACTLTTVRRSICCLL